MILAIGLGDIAFYGGFAVVAFLLLYVVWDFVRFAKAWLRSLAGAIREHKVISGVVGLALMVAIVGISVLLIDSTQKSKAEPSLIVIEYPLTSDDKPWEVKLTIHGSPASARQVPQDQTWRQAEVGLARFDAPGAVMEARLRTKDPAKAKVETGTPLRQGISPLGVLEWVWNVTPTEGADAVEVALRVDGAATNQAAVELLAPERTLRTLILSDGDSALTETWDLLLGIPLLGAAILAVGKYVQTRFLEWFGKRLGIPKKDWQFGDT
jgi:hypothetical protein